MTGQIPPLRRRLPQPPGAHQARDPNRQGLCSQELHPRPCRDRRYLRSRSRHRRRIQIDLGQLGSRRSPRWPEDDRQHLHVYIEEARPRALRPQREEREVRPERARGRIPDTHARQGGWRVLPHPAEGLSTQRESVAGGEGGCG